MYHSDRLIFEFLVDAIPTQYIVCVASSPGHSHVFNVTLKTWEWPGDEAIVCVVYTRFIIV